MAFLSITRLMSRGYAHPAHGKSSTEAFEQQNNSMLEIVRNHPLAKLSIFGL
jgi:hypothetical protein